MIQSKPEVAYVMTTTGQSHRTVSSHQEFSSILKMTEAQAALRDIRDNMLAKDGAVFKRLIAGLGLAEEALATALARAETLAEALAPTPRVNGGLVGFQHSAPQLEELLIDERRRNSGLAKDLKVAQQEIAAWDGISAWIAAAPGDRACEIGMWVDGTHTCMPTAGPLVCANHTGATRLEAVTEAETWCRSEMTK